MSTNNYDDEGNVTVHSRRAADAVIEKLEEQIVSGVLENDAPLPAERNLMEQFNASRTVIREAIATLSSRGLIESKPRYRPIVRKPDYETALTAVGGVVRHLLSEHGGVKNLYDSRVFIERALVREAALSAQKDDIQQLRQALADNERSIGDSAAFYATDTAFHGVLYKVPKNPIFPAIHEGYTSWLAPHWEKMLRSPERNTVNYKSHEAIFMAIVERDPDAAEEALVNHLKAAWEYVRVTFDAGEL
ncbi:FCD domain-containing protein [Hoeflea prorocentri]|uniref:FCD domain-containing protein n=1 Tax=Hoeflea prorocentri TaxID=1922333 RepID=A0A9X3UK78_9HYPH|nr:FCD domain-containing protein [Hoeflea prorocentri]MCY6382179.1 FCD domain-containing protein [Hoeflea prorocentri]MDA5399979.1 FCD domain-containing protein [Hoeflea prorocentri]